MKNFSSLIYHTKALKTIAGLTILLLLSAFSLSAQNKTTVQGKITGRIIDSISGLPLEYATISIYTQKENKLINGTTSDEKGIFKLSDLPNGNYKILFDFIGYSIQARNNVAVKGNTEIILGDIKLISTQTALNGVTITGGRAIIENKIDRMVYNADKDITSQSGVAADVLKKVPQVSVDVDGNVELQGNSSIRFLINGKPSALFGSNIADVLQSIPASQIQSIDIITSPGAKYDAEGTGGIINIILKKTTAHGINGNISVSAGTRLENGAFNLNARKGNFGANAYVSGNAQLLSTTYNDMNRLSQQDSVTFSQLLQSSVSDFKRSGLQSGVGFDWDITPKNNLSATLSYDYFGMSNTGNADRQTLFQDISGNQISDVKDVINSSNNFHEYSFDWNLAYKKKFNKEDQELEVVLNSSKGNIYSYYDQAQQHVDDDAIFNSSYGHNPGIENETNMEVNYTQPLGTVARLETGVKTELDHIQSTSEVYLLNTSTDTYEYSTDLSSKDDYHRVVYAGYLSATFKLFKQLDVKAGFRDEYTTGQADFSNSGNVTLRSYNTFVPSIVVSHTFKENEVLKLSYSHRIERPDYRDLNPFVNASDPKNVSTGNPNLLPEIGNKIELGFSQSYKNGANVTLTMFYRGNRDDIQAYTTYYPTYQIGDSIYTNVAVSTRENIGSEDNYGLNLFASAPLTKKLNLRSNISCFQRYIITGLASGGNKQGFNYRINVNATYQLSSTLIIEALGNFNSPRINAQGTMPSFTTYNFAFRKQLFNKKASIALTATNFFNKYIDQKTELAGINFNTTNDRQLPYRSFGFNFTYKFGKMDFKDEKEIEDRNLNGPQQ